MEVGMRVGNKKRIGGVRMKKVGNGESGGLDGGRWG